VCNRNAGEGGLEARNQKAGNLLTRGQLEEARIQQEKISQQPQDAKEINITRM
jgi:hypothetical protein